MGRLLLLFFIFVFLSSCGDSLPENVLSKETMVPLLTDLHIADGYAASMYGPENEIKVASAYKSLYKKYSTDSIGVRRSLEYYTKRPDELQLIYVDVEKRILQLQKEEQRRLALQQKEELRKVKIEQAKKQRKIKFAEFRSRFSKGKYAFGESYKTPADAYLRRWKRPVKTPKPVVKKDSLKTDSLKRKLLLNKESRR